MKVFAIVLAAALAWAGVASAQPAATTPAPTIVRGTLVGVSGDTLKVRRKKGPPVVVTMNTGWAVAVMKPIGPEAIQPGSFIGTAEMPQADGTGRSLEVHIFPPGVKMGEGHYDWDLRQGSMMTNGTVGTVTATPKGRALTVSYPSGSRQIVVPPKVPIVQITPGTVAQLKPGVPLFLVAFPKPGGGLISNAVSIGENGKAPPM
jgi:hypothetical protein